MRECFSPGTTRWIVFFFWVIACGILFFKPLSSLLQLAVHDDSASHIILVPLVSAWLLFLDRQRLQESVSDGHIVALGSLILGGVITYLSHGCQSCSAKAQLAGYILGLILSLTAGFIWILGLEAAKGSLFALAFLLFALPVPDTILNPIIYVLQAGSAAVAGFFFDLSGTPALRQGFIFYLPRVSIEVAKECSGIRSSIALLILALLVAYFSFRPFWKKIVFVTAGLLMMLIKNGIRITSLTLLANYVSPEFLYGRLHREGGVVFFLIGLALLVPVYWLLRRGESDMPPLEGKE